MKKYKVLLIINDKLEKEYNWKKKFEKENEVDYWKICHFIFFSFWRKWIFEDENKYLKMKMKLSIVDALMV